MSIATTTRDIYTPHIALEEASKQCFLQSSLLLFVGVVVVFDVLVVEFVVVFDVLVVEFVVVFTMTSSAILIIALVSNVIVPPKDPVYVLVIV